MQHSAPFGGNRNGPTRIPLIGWIPDPGLRGPGYTSRGRLPASMLNFVRILFLLLSGLAAATVWVVQNRPDWIARVDGWSTARHLAGPQDRWDAIQAADQAGQWDGSKLRDQLESALEDLEPVALGDRRYPLWRTMVQRLVEVLGDQGALAEAAAWQGRLAQSDPTDFHARLHWCERLLATGEPASIAAAREELRFLHRKLPDWAEPAQALLRLALQDEDRAAIESMLPAWARGAQAHLREGWQVLAWGDDQSTPWVSPRLSLSVDPETGRWILHGSGWPFAKLQRLRVDPPPGATGWIEDWNWLGQTAQGDSVSVPLLRADEVVRSEAGGFGLQGAADPRMTSDAGLPALVATSFDFAWHAGLPREVFDVAERHPDWKAAWQTQPWWGAVLEVRVP